jgi:hypothetical protein
MFIHNISQSIQTFIGQPIQVAEFYAIPESRKSAYSDSDELLKAIIDGDVAISIDGINDLQEKTLMIKTLFGEVIVTSPKIPEGGKRKSDRGFTFTAIAGQKTSADFLITEDLQIKGGILICLQNHIFDNVDMEIVDTSFLYAGDWYPSTPTEAGISNVEGLTWAQVVPTGVSLHHYLKGFPVSKDGATQIKNSAITDTPLNGLTIRVSYDSKGAIDVPCNVGIVAYT